MRTFSLTNSKGTTYDLTNKGTAFLHSVGGLGYTEEGKYQRIGTRYSRYQSRMKQGVIKGSIKFWNSGAQAEYESFINFCQQTPLVLSYDPTGSKTYYCRCTLSEADFDEKNALTIDVEFTQLTPFFEKLYVVTYADEDSTYGKIYDYEYPYVYTSATANSVTINQSSAIESPCKLTMYGPLVNPQWNHYVNNTLYASGAITGTIASGNRLVVDCTGDTLSMIVYDSSNNVVTDMYQESDFSTERAIYLQYGKNTITVSDEGSNKVTVVAEGEIQYASV